MCLLIKVKTHAFYMLVLIGNKQALSRNLENA